MNVVKWECPGYPGNQQVFPCPYFQQHGFSVTGDFHTEVWPDWAAVPWRWTAPQLIFVISSTPLCLLRVPDSALCDSVCDVGLRARHIPHLQLRLPFIGGVATPNG